METLYLTLRIPSARSSILLPQGCTYSRRFPQLFTITPHVFGGGGNNNNAIDMHCEVSLDRRRRRYGSHILPMLSSSLLLSTRYFSTFPADKALDHSSTLTSWKDSPSNDDDNSNLQYDSEDTTNDNNKEQSAIIVLTQATARHLRKHELRLQLQQRHLGTWGDRRKLVERLIKSLPLTTCQSSPDSMDSAKRKGILTNLQHNDINTLAHVDATSSHEKRQIQPEHTYIISVKAVSSPVIKSTGIGIILQDAHYPEAALWLVQKYLPDVRCVYQAEYSALVMAVRYALQRGIRNVWVQLDHDVIVRQIQGQYKITHNGFRSLYWQVMHLQECLDSFRITQVSKDHVAEATELALRALATGKNINNMDDGYDPTKDYGTRSSEISAGNSILTALTEEDASNTNSTPSLLCVLDQSHDNIDIVTRDCTSTFSSARTVSNSIDNDNSYAQNDLFSSPSPPISITKGVYTFQDRPIIDPHRVYRLQFDGNTHRNGLAGAGVVIYDDRCEEIWCAWQYLGLAVSSHVAEYQSLLLGLQCAQALGIRRLHAQGDSELTVRQICGRCKVRDNVRIFWERTQEVIRTFEQVELDHIRREYNKRADWLATHAVVYEHSFGIL
jgi:ribonuclease HI